MNFFTSAKKIPDSGLRPFTHGPAPFRGMLYLDFRKGRGWVEEGGYASPTNYLHNFNSIKNIAALQACRRVLAGRGNEALDTESYALKRREL